MLLKANLVVQFGMRPHPKLNHLSTHLECTLSVKDHLVYEEFYLRFST
jgi:hypothetical protein